MNQEILDNTEHRGIERLFRRRVRGDAAFHLFLCIVIFLCAVGLVELFFDLPVWVWHACIALPVLGIAKFAQCMNARRYAVAISEHDIRLIPDPQHQGDVARARDLASVSLQRFEFLQYFAAWTLVWTVLCITFHVFPEGIPSWAMRMSVFFGPVGLALIIAFPWTARMISSISASLALVGCLLAIWVIARTGTWIRGEGVIGATLLILWLVHRTRLWGLSHSLFAGRSLGGIGAAQLPLRMQPKWGLAQLLTGGGLVVLWYRDGRVVVHPFEPNRSERGEFAHWLNFISPHVNGSDTLLGGLQAMAQSEMITGAVTVSIREARQGRLSAAIRRCQRALEACESTGAVNLAIYVVDTLVEHLITAGQGVEARGLINRYERTAKDCGLWFTQASLRNAAAIIWALYGYIDLAIACIVGNGQSADITPRASLQICRRRLVPFVAASALNNLGMCYLCQTGLLRNRGQFQSALLYAVLSRQSFRRARRILWWGRWLSLGHQLVWESALANEAEALRYQAEITHAAHQSQGEVAAHKLSKPLYQEAAWLYAKWLHHAERSGTLGGDQLSGAALMFAGNEQFDKAEECLRNAISIVQTQPEDVYHFFVAHKRYGDYLASQGRLRMAHQHYEKAMRVLESCPFYQTEAITRHYGSWERSELFVKAIKTAIKLEEYEVALLDAERSRQERFRQVVSRTIFMSRPLSSEDEERIGRMLDEILKEQNSQSAANGHPSTGGASDQRLRREASQDPGGLEWLFEQIPSTFTPRVPSSITKIAAAIPDESAIIMYHVIDEKLYAFCLSRNGSPSKPVPLVAVLELEDLLVHEDKDQRTGKKKYMPRLLALKEEKKACNQLYEWLLAPLLPQLDGVTRLYVVPTKPLLSYWAGDDEPLTGVPFAALRDEHKKRLIEEDGRFPRGIAYLPYLTPQPVVDLAAEAGCCLDKVFKMADDFPDVRPCDGGEILRDNLSATEILTQLGNSRQAVFYAHGYSLPNAPLLSGLSRTAKCQNRKSVLLTGLDCLRAIPTGRAKVAITACSTAVMKADDVRVSGGEETLEFVQPMLRHAEVVIGSLWDCFMDDYDAFSRFLIARGRTNEEMDPIQATADWQREMIAKRKAIKEWAWPMVWTTLQPTSTTTATEEKR